MNICFVTTGDIKNLATAKRALGMSNPLVELGWTVSILMLDSEENRKRVKMECSDHVQVYYFPYSSSATEIKNKNAYLKKIQPDYVYICAFVIRNLVGLFDRKMRKLVEHSELQSGIPDVRGAKKILASQMEFFSIFYSNRLICASQFLTDYYGKLKSRWRPNLDVFYHPYAYASGIYRKKELDELPISFRSLNDKKNFVFLGTITRNYGVFTMIEAVEQLLAEKIDVRLILLGRGRHFDQALTYINTKGITSDHILMPGFIEEVDIENYFSCATAFISPMNNTVQDKARCPSKLYMYLPFEKPVITCEIGEPYHVMGNQGYYYESGSVKSLADQIKILLKAPESSHRIADAELHTWEYRTNQFHQWITK